MAKKITEIVLEPSTLILQLKRYEYDTENQRSVKKHNIINIPHTINLPSGSTYFLCSVINHIGANPEEGHYNVLLFDKNKNTFTMLDDAKIIFDAVVDDEMNKLPYIITYIKN